MELSSNHSIESIDSQPPPDGAVDTLLSQLEALFRQPGREQKLEQCQAITAQIALSLRIDHAQLMSRNRTQRVGFVREVAMFLCRRITKASWHILGEFFHRDHSTVIANCQVIERRMIRDSAFRRFVQQLAAKAMA